jgi:hypothetical protein
MVPPLHKYPRTPHLEGSLRRPDDEELGVIPFAEIAGRHLVVEEKLDGANSAISFDEAGALRLQSRGHFLTGGYRERHFNLLKAWAACHQARLFEILGRRYVMYGEWLYAKHTVFYDALPHYFLEFDVLDRSTGAFLSTEGRRGVLASAPVVSVPVLHAGPINDLTALRGMIGPSLYKTAAWRQRLRDSLGSLGLNAELAIQQTDPSDEREGLYVKVEEKGQVTARCKLVRPSFLQTVLDSGSHWLDRPIVPNLLREGADIFGAEI